MNIGFERIVPTPTYPVGTSAPQLLGLDWESQRTIVTKFKDGLKVALRKAQIGLCCFCRRQLHDDGDVDVEHFVDKNLYPSYTFEVMNLGLSCGTCNSNKNGRFRSLRTRFRKRYADFGPWFPITPTISRRIGPSSPFPVNAEDFRWVNPHFHNYSEHIELSDSFVFRGISPQGRRTIRGCKLNDLARVELRVFSERLQRQSSGGLSEMITDLDSLSSGQVTDVLQYIALTVREAKSGVV